MIQTRRSQADNPRRSQAPEPKVGFSAASHVDQESFRDIFTRHARFVGRALKALGVMDADLDDVCQDVFLVVHRRLDEFEGRCSLRSWLYAISVRVAADYRKSAYVTRLRTREALTELPAPCELGRPEARLLLSPALAALSDDTRDVLLLHEIEGFSVPEAADILGCPVQTAYTRLQSAHHQVGRFLRRAQLAKTGTDAPGSKSPVSKPKAMLLRRKRAQH
jgi:RNA polymerase sigma-70 factor (ECF subfamily)